VCLGANISVNMVFIYFQCGGKEKMKEIYLEKLKQLENENMDKKLLCKRLEDVGTLL
jgi:hypothetical protein